MLPLQSRHPLVSVLYPLGPSKINLITLLYDSTSDIWTKWSCTPRAFSSPKYTFSNISWCGSHFRPFSVPIVIVTSRTENTNRVCGRTPRAAKHLLPVLGVYQCGWQFLCVKTHHVFDEVKYPDLWCVHVCIGKLLCIFVHIPPSLSLFLSLSFCVPLFFPTSSRKDPFRQFQFRIHVMRIRSVYV